MARRAHGAEVDAVARGAVLERLILDTTVLIAAERGGAPLDEVVDDDDDVAIAAVTAAELLVGVALAGPSRLRAREQFVDELLAKLPIEPYDHAAARQHARLLAETRRSGRPRGAHDLLIAATAAAGGRTVVTADAAGFGGLPGIKVRVLALDP